MSVASPVSAPRAERFEIRRSLGSGGFGEVYEAWDTQKEAVVAVKTIRRVGAESVHRFKREFRQLAGLSHPNLVQLYELVCEDEDWFFSMELVRGQDFVSAVREVAAPPAPRFRSMDESGRLLQGETLEQGVDPTTGPLDALERPLYDEKRLRAALRQLARGIQALHQAGKLHRDIKPHNVMVDEGGRVVLLDFGMVKELTDASEDKEGKFVGTPHYMSPEQALDGPVGRGSDWYSVGVMLYEVLVGSYPVEGRAVMQILLRKQKAEAPDVSDFPPGTPEDLRDLCRSLLQRKPEDRPDGTEVLRMLGVSDAEHQQLAAVRESSVDGAFVGRREELSLLAAAHRRVRRDRRPVAVQVTGRSGIGKSAVVNHFLDRLAGEVDPWILTGRSYENESVPFKAFDAVIDQIVDELLVTDPDERDAVLPAELGALARVFPAFQRLSQFRDVVDTSYGASTAPDLRVAAFAALRELLDAFALRRDIVMFFDDVQWGDRDSGELMRALLDGESPPPILLLLTFREGDNPGEMLTPLEDDVFADAVPFESIELAELAAHEARELASALLGGDSEHVERVITEGRGNPYFIDQLSRSSSGGEPAGTLDDTIARRLKSFGDEVQEFLEVVALAGRPIDVAAVRDIVGSRADVLQAVTRLRNERFVRLTTTTLGERIESYHDRIRETVRDRLPEERRRRTHLRIATVLEKRTGIDPEMLALHFRDGGERVRAGTYFRAAGDAALDAFAYDSAARNYQQALDLGEWSDEERCSILVPLGTVLSYLGRGNESSEAFVRAAPLTESARAVELRRRAADQLLRAGQIERGIELLYEVMHGLDLPTPAEGGALDLSLLWSTARNWFRGRSYELRDEPLDLIDAVRLDTCFSAANLLGTIDIKKGAFFQLLNFRLALDSGDPDAITRTLALQAVHSSGRARTLDRADALLAEAAEVQEHAADQFVAATYVDFSRGMSHYMSGEFSDAYRWFEDVGSRLASKGERYVWEFQLVQLYKLFVLFVLGKLDTYARTVDEQIGMAKERDDLLQWSAVSIWKHLHFLMRDSPRQATEVVDDATRSWSSEGYHLQHYWALGARVRIALYEGEPARALSYLDEAWGDLRGSLLLSLDISAILMFELRARARLGMAAMGDPVSLRKVRADIRRLESCPRDLAKAMATCLRAQLAFVEGDTSAHADQLARAEAQFAALGHETIVSAIRMRLGEALGPGRGAELTARARAWFTRQGVEDPDRFASVMLPVHHPDSGGTK